MEWPLYTFVNCLNLAGIVYTTRVCSYTICRYFLVMVLIHCKKVYRMSEYIDRVYLQIYICNTNNYIVEYKQ